MTTMTTMTTKRALASAATLAACTLFATVAPAQMLSPWPYTTQQGPPQPSGSDPPRPGGLVTSWEPLRFAVAVEGRAQWLRDDAAKRLAGTHAPTSGGLTVQAEILRPTDHIGVRVDLGWSTLSVSNSQDGTGVLERLQTNVVELGVSGRYALLPWLSPYARLAAGFGWDKVTLGSGGDSLHDRQGFGKGSAGAGIMLRSPGIRLWQSTSPHFIGLMAQIEGGYAVANGSDFALQSAPGGSGQNAIPTSAVALGHIDRSAPYLRFLGGLAF